MTKSLNLRAGEWVEIRSADEILRTLDDRQSLDGLPFMPEMLQYCGKRFRVYKTAHKTCDTIKHYAIRRMKQAVHLEGLRCDGEGHGGCQAGCLLFWKEAWLRRADPEYPAHTRAAESLDRGPHWSALLRGTRAASPSDGGERYRCQATDLLAFTTEVRRRDRWNPLLYVKDLTSRNVTLREFIWYGVFAMLNAFTERWFGWRYPYLCGSASKLPAAGALNLQPGDLVRVKSKHEVEMTLGQNMKNRGLHFDVEMVPFCEAGTHRVLRKVERIVDEKTGLLLQMQNPCLILDGVTCSGKLSSSRMFCPRNIYPYWREVWLERADARPHHQEADGPR